MPQGDGTTRRGLRRPGAVSNRPPSNLVVFSISEVLAIIDQVIRSCQSGGTPPDTQDIGAQQARRVLGDIRNQVWSHEGVIGGERWTALIAEVERVLTGLRAGQIPFPRANIDTRPKENRRQVGGIPP